MLDYGSFIPLGPGRGKLGRASFWKKKQKLSFFGTAGRAPLGSVFSEREARPSSPLAHPPAFRHGPNASVTPGHGPGPPGRSNLFFPSPPAPRAACAPAMPRQRLVASSAVARSGGGAGMAPLAPLRPAAASTGAARFARPTADTGPMTSATPDFLAGMIHPALRGTARQARPSSAAISPLSRSDRPLPSPSPRTRRAVAQAGIAAHRSSGLNDQAHADRCHPRGRNPCGGAGR